MKIRYITLALAALFMAACNSNSNTNESADTIMETDSSMMNPAGTDTMDHSGNMADTTGLSNGTTYQDSI